MSPYPSSTGIQHDIIRRIRVLHVHASHPTCSPPRGRTARLQEAVPAGVRPGHLIIRGPSARASRGSGRLDLPAASSLRSPIPPWPPPDDGTTMLRSAGRAKCSDEPEPVNTMPASPACLVVRDQPGRAPARGRPSLGAGYRVRGHRTIARPEPGRCHPFNLLRHSEIESLGRKGFEAATRIESHMPLTRSRRWNLTEACASSHPSL